MKTTNLSTLTIHKLTQAQYDREVANGTIDENALYLTPDEEVDLSNYMTSTDPVGTGSFSMNRKRNSTVGNYSTTLGNGNTASDLYSIAIGSDNEATATASFAEGYGTHAMGTASHSGGISSYAYGNYSFAFGYNTKANSDYSIAQGYKTNAYLIQHATGKYTLGTLGAESGNTQDSTSSDAVFVVGCGTSSAGKNAFRVSSSGKCYGNGVFGTSGADFAELFEWVDGNPNNEDRRGLFVTLEGDRVRIANTGDDYIGVISGNEAFVGNTASEEWQGKYLSDVFGTKLSQTIEIPAEINEETGEVIKEAFTTTQYVINPDYDPNEEYVMRENRKEWGTVGMLGQVVVIDDGTCVVGGRVEPSINGIGTASDKGYRVMKRIDENHIKVLVK